MQSNNGFNINGFMNPQYYNCCNIPPPNNTIYPEVIGEGEIASMLLSDGTVQYFFVPLVKWCPSNIYQPNLTNNANIVGAWLIRGISNPTPTFSSSYRCEVPVPNFSPNYNMNQQNPITYQIKFHNDKWTSTTDIHYFYPSLRQYDYSLKQSSKGHAAVQMETLNTICYREVVCNKPCHCNDEPKLMSTTSLQETSQIKCACASTEALNEQKEVDRKKQHKKSFKIKSDECYECPPTADKCITTYTDTASGRMEVDGQETQTCTTKANPAQGLNKTSSANTTPITYVTQSSCHEPTPTNEHEQLELWYPKTPVSRKGIQTASEYRRTSGHSSNCCCNSDTDRTDE